MPLTGGRVSPPSRWSAASAAARAAAALTARSRHVAQPTRARTRQAAHEHVDCPRRRVARGRSTPGTRCSDQLPMPAAAARQIAAEPELVGAPRGLDCGSDAERGVREATWRTPCAGQRVRPLLKASIAPAHASPASRCCGSRSSRVAADVAQGSSRQRTCLRQSSWTSGLRQHARLELTRSGRRSRTRRCAVRAREPRLPRNCSSRCSTEAQTPCRVPRTDGDPAASPAW